MSMENLTPEVLAKNPFLAGVAGSLLGLYFAPGLNWGARLMNGIGGFACAIYGTQLLVWFMKLESVGAIAGLSFMVGVLGMVVMDAMVKGLRETRVGEFLNGALQRLLGFFGRGNDKTEG